MRKTEKVIFIVGAPFNCRDYKRFGIEIFINNGIEVDVWDITPLLYPFAHNYIQPPDPIRYKNLNRFYQKNDIIVAIEKESKRSFIVSLIPYCLATLIIFRSISKRNIPYCVSNANVTSGIPLNWNFRYIAKVAKTINFNKIMNYFLKKIDCRRLAINHAAIYLLGGKKSLKKKPEVGNETEIIWVHTYDYDVYLQVKKHPKRKNKIVFLDNYFPFHPDYIFKKRKFKDPEKYYPLLNKFFDYIEQKIKLKVVIAAHPRSNYEKLPDFFNGRRVVRNRSAELIKDAQCILLHSSTAISYCVLFKKPMIFITSDELNKHRIGIRTEISASYFGKKPINISRNMDFNLNNELIIDYKKYTEYKQDYIKIDGTGKKQFWEIVRRKIDKLSQQS